MELASWAPFSDLQTGFICTSKIPPHSTFPLFSRTVFSQPISCAELKQELPIAHLPSRKDPVEGLWPRLVHIHPHVRNGQEDKMKEQKNACWESLARSPGTLSDNKVLLDMIYFDFYEMIFLMETSDSLLWTKLKILVHVYLWFK